MSDNHGNTPAAWTAVAVAMLGFVVGGVALMLDPVSMTLFWVGIALGALLWAFIDVARTPLSAANLPREIATIMQGIIVLSVVVAYEVVNRYNAAAEQRQVAKKLEAVPA